MSIFSSHSDFDKHHQEIGAICDYAGMKTEMLNEIDVSSIIDWAHFPEIDLDVSWLEFDCIFEGVLDGVSEFIGTILDGI